MAPSSDRRAQRNRSRDPSWIPRPRNAFIIFRCEYSRKHSQAAQQGEVGIGSLRILLQLKPSRKERLRRGSSCLPSEKDAYKVLADKEREEHARLYPHYRFRPMRRQSSGLKKRHYDLGLSNSSFLLDSSDEQVPTFIADADEDSQEECGAAHQQAIEKEASETSGDSAPKDASEDSAARRSSSVPLPDVFPAPIFSSHTPKDDSCRSRSTEGREWPLRPLGYVSQAAHVRFGKEFEAQPQQWHAASNDASPFVSFDFGASTGEHNISIDNQPESRLALELGYQSSESQAGLTYTPSSFTIASSLSGWNVDPLSPCMPGQAMLPSSDGLLAPYEDMERAQALEAYALGLQNFDFFTNPLPVHEYPDHGSGIPCDIEYSALFQEQATES
ncbi:hypothetical protein EDD22DRAFT_949169 [Suillus occidentalis]|nr:hypothetical protein EDD22DRAFT_949169 [Suillus occidentalis]